MLDPDVPDRGDDLAADPVAEAFASPRRGREGREGRRVALVTGASRGIGAACAVALARDGFDVALAARSISDLDAVAARCADQGARTTVIPTDVTQESQVRNMPEKAATDLGSLSVLVNGAGWAGPPAPLLRTRSEVIDKLVRLDLASVVWALQAAGKILVGQGEGSVVNVAALGALTSAPDRATYAAAKAGIVSLTRSAAAEWGPAGVRVNAVAPGWVKTDLNRSLWSDEERARATVADAPLARWGTAEEVAEVVAFLAGPRASYVTGQTVAVDGGLGGR